MVHFILWLLIPVTNVSKYMYVSYYTKILLQKMHELCKGSCKRLNIIGDTLKASISKKKTQSGWLVAFEDDKDKKQEVRRAINLCIHQWFHYNKVTSLILGFFQIRRTTVEKYCGDGEPPSWKLIIQKPNSVDATLADCDGAVKIDGSRGQSLNVLIKVRSTSAGSKWIATCK